uniref:Fidgetin-like protein 1 n=2 Tax=Ciona intestinalis TaxID=7719 RepID=H2Y395_CIOIN
RVKRHHEVAFNYMTRALEIDENESIVDKKEALMLYLCGVGELEKGVNIRGEGVPGEREKIDRLQTKMLKNLTMARERVSVLSNKKDESAKSTQSLKVNSSKRNHSPTTRGNSGSTARVTLGQRPGGNSGSTPRGNSGSTSRGNSGSTRGNSGSTSDKPTKKKPSKTLRSVPEEMAKRIMDTAVKPEGNMVKFDDVTGQHTAKQALQEIVILPALRPDLFHGLRSPAKGLLLFGPPGNGKTLLAKAVASEAKSVFFNISAATLTSKWVGEGEKMVKALFAVAREVQPSIIFIDEIDSLLRTRQENENDSTRRLQTEFLLQFDGVGSGEGDQVLVMGATNRPHELDDAALRRFPKRIYVRLPDVGTRGDLIKMLLKKHDSPLGDREIKELGRRTEGYSFSDLTELAKDASLGPVREIPQAMFTTIDVNSMRKINFNDFLKSLKKIRPSPSMELLKTYESWNSHHGDTSDS